VADQDVLGGLLRAWRDRAAPAELGHRPDKRRAPGMRREELASLADLSVDYIVRLEQGRKTRPSLQVVAALARALRLSAEELAVLHRAAGLAPPTGGVERRVPQTVERLTARLDRLPAAVYSADWWLLRWNSSWAALLGDPAAMTGLNRNLVWQVFDARQWRAQPAGRPLDEFQQTLVADLRTLLVEHPHDQQLGELVEALRKHRPDFAWQWAEGGAARLRSERKRVTHPQVGNLLLDCDVLQVPGSDVRVLLFSAEPGSPDASRLELLSASGNDTLIRY
jgi:transcriptional regulator with XRE-family HTH domain